MKGVRCLECKNFLVTTEDFVPTCKAFPDGIPDDIFWEKVLHDKPYPNDNGFRYEPEEK